MGFQNRRPDVKPPSIAGCQGKAESSVEVTHLALARRQNTGNGSLGILLKKKGSCESDCLFLSDEEKSKEPAYEYGYIMNII